MGNGTEPDDIERVINDALDRARRDRDYGVPGEQHVPYLVQPMSAAVGPRDLFAAHVIQAILQRIDPKQFNPIAMKDFTKNAFEVADMMMEARNAQKE